MKAAAWVSCVVIVGIVVPGCQKPAEEPVPLIMETDYAAALPPGQIALRKVTDPAGIPDFRPAFHLQTELDTAAARSLNYLSKPSSHKYFPYDPSGEITHDRAVRSLELFRRTLAEAASPEQLDALIRKRFEVWESVGCDGEGTVLFTGYYCPIFDARLQPDDRFRYPLYQVPGDLIKDSEGNCKGRRLPGGGIAPTYYDRREIVSGNVAAGYELCYLSDPFEAYIVTVQGSAKLRLADGSYFEIGYEANNGYDYVSVGRLMVEDGRIPANELSLAAMIEYFNNNPQRAGHALPQHRHRQGGLPAGLRGLRADPAAGPRGRPHRRARLPRLRPGPGHRRRPAGRRPLRRLPGHRRCRRPTGRPDPGRREALLPVRQVARVARRALPCK